MNIPQAHQDFELETFEHRRRHQELSQCYQMENITLDERVEMESLEELINDCLQRYYQKWRLAFGDSDYQQFEDEFGWSFDDCYHIYEQEKPLDRQ